MLSLFWAVPSSARYLGYRLYGLVGAGGRRRRWSWQASSPCSRWRTGSWGPSAQLLGYSLMNLRDVLRHIQHRPLVGRAG